MAKNELEGVVTGIPAHQSLRRPLTGAEQALAVALEEIFAAGVHEFPVVATLLQERHVERPSGSTEPWSTAALEAELKGINDSLDQAYARGGAAPAGG
jgi:hypothetical protein